MKYVKSLGLLAVVVAALTASSGIASAETKVTSPEGTTYTGNITATSTNSELHGAFVTVKCTHSEVRSKVEKHGEDFVHGKVSSLTFTGCNYLTTVKAGGSLTLNTKGEVFSSGAEVEILTSVGVCIFTTNGTKVGTLAAGKNAVLNIGSSTIWRTGGNFLCGPHGIWTGSYDLTTPNDLWVD